MVQHASPGVMSKATCRITLDRYFAFDRGEIHGSIAAEPDAGPVKRYDVRVISLARDERVQDVAVAVQDSNGEAGSPFTISTARLAGGYYRVETDGAAPVHFVLHEEQNAASTGTGDPDRFLRFVVQTVDRMIECQSANLGGGPNGARFITVCNASQKSYRSIGSREGTKFLTYWFPELPFEYETVRSNMECWPVLDRLSELTGSPKYADLVSGMADAFARHGFDGRTGLGYLGEEADFDLVRIRGMGSGAYIDPKFKPGNSGSCPGMPLGRLWAHAPQQMAKMFKAMFYGLITDPEKMDYNRFTPLDFDFEQKKTNLGRHSWHLAFSSAGARMIHWWSSAFAQTGDVEYLDWGQRMADKWIAVQHPESGLVPEHFGGRAGESAEMPPALFCNSRDSSISSVAYIQAAAELERRPEGRKLAEQLRGMSLRLARGIARHAYDPARRRFREYMHLDGRPYDQIARYCFPTEQDKREAVQHDPQLEQVAVFDGVGLYRDEPYWSHVAGTEMPEHIARVGVETRDPELIEAARKIAEDALAEAAKLTSEFTANHCWTFRGSAEYIKVLLHLHAFTGETIHLDRARDLADQELHRLSKVKYPEWWRLRERTDLLDALLRLHAACSGRGLT